MTNVLIIMFQILGIVSVGFMIISLLFAGKKWLFPNGIYSYFCSHNWEFYKSVESFASFSGETFSSTNDYFKCKKCGDVRKV